MADISPHAVVEPTARIAAGVSIGPFSYIGPHVSIASHCTIESNVSIVGKTQIGEKTHVFPMAVIGLGREGVDKPAQVVIGQANIIREHVVIYGGAAGATQVGSDNLLMIGCQVGASCRIGHHGIFANCTHFGDGCVVEDYVRTSAFIHVQTGFTVGAYTFLLSLTDLDRDAPPFAMVQGSPFRVRGVNSENLRRCGFEQDEIRQLKHIFRELYDNDGQADPQVLSRLLGQKGLSAHVRQLLEAVARGKARAGGGANG